MKYVLREVSVSMDARHRGILDLPGKLVAVVGQGAPTEAGWDLLVLHELPRDPGTATVADLAPGSRGPDSPVEPGGSTGARRGGAHGPSRRLTGGGSRGTL